jgi:hypothetical protein
MKIENLSQALLPTVQFAIFILQFSIFNAVVEGAELPEIQ